MVFRAKTGFSRPDFPHSRGAKSIAPSLQSENNPAAACFKRLAFNFFNAFSFCLPPVGKVDEKKIPIILIPFGFAVTLRKTRASVQKEFMIRNPFRLQAGNDHIIGFGIHAQFEPFHGTPVKVVNNEMTALMHFP